LASLQSCAVGAELVSPVPVMSLQEADFGSALTCGLDLFDAAGELCCVGDWDGSDLIGGRDGGVLRASAAFLQSSATCSRYFAKSFLLPASTALPSSGKQLFPCRPSHSCSRRVSIGIPVLFPYSQSLSY